MQIIDIAHDERLIGDATGAMTLRAVSLNPGTPYVFVNYTFKGRRTWLYQTYVLWQHDDVLDFCIGFKGNKSRKIVDIFLLEPVRHGTVYTWRWDKVQQIRKGKYDAGDVYFPVYVTSAEQAVGMPPEQSLSETELIYKAKNC